MRGFLFYYLIVSLFHIVILLSHYIISSYRPHFLPHPATPRKSEVFCLSKHTPNARKSDPCCVFRNFSFSFLFCLDMKY